MKYYLAVDIGASSGRHMLGHLEDGKLVMEEIYRFKTHSAQKNESWAWECDSLADNVIKGMEACKSAGKIPCMMGIDTWGADFMLLDNSGEKLCDCADFRNEALLMKMIPKVEQIISYTELYKRTGISKMPFDSIYQLMALKLEYPDVLSKANTFLMIPSYINYLLTGIIKEEYTCASTTGLIDVKSKTWDSELIATLGFPNELFGEIHMPGEIVGNLTSNIKKRVGFDCSVVLPATHDTASAYLAAPTMEDNAAYISSGTWSLLGTKSDIPVNTLEAMRMGFSNEGAFPSNYKVIKTIIGMYMLEMIRHELPDKYSYDKLISMAIEAKEINSFIDMRNLSYLMTPSIIEAVKSECAKTEQQVPESVGQVLQVVFRSMAKTYARVISDLQQITGKNYAALYIVGGGSQNDYLNFLTAEATGIPVYAGPHEATVIGNLLSQMLISNEFPDLESALKVERESFSIKKFA